LLQNSKESTSAGRNHKRAAKARMRAILAKRRKGYVIPAMMKVIKKLAVSHATHNLAKKISALKMKWAALMVQQTTAIIALNLNVALVILTVILLKNL
jgi:predicted pyridoxine 5'-phosphate oxidase superfamily flavin-nucleotide-binding protein